MKFNVGDKVKIKPSKVETGFSKDEYYIGQRFMEENEILEVNKNGSYRVKASNGIGGYYWDVCENQLELILKYKIIFCFLDKNNAVQTDDYGCEMYYDEEVEAESKEKAVKKFKEYFDNRKMDVEIVDIIRR